MEYYIDMISCCHDKDHIMIIKLYLSRVIQEVNNYEICLFRGQTEIT